MMLSWCTVHPFFFLYGFGQTGSGELNGVQFGEVTRVGVVSRWLGLERGYVALGFGRSLGFW